MVEEVTVMPAMFDHCMNVYNKMREQAVVTEVADGERMLVWEGFLTKLTRGLGLSTPYYTTVKRDLVRMGCMQQLRRGGGSSPSQWELKHKPTQELFHNAAGKLSKPTAFDTVNQRLTDLHERLCVVEQAIGTIVSAVNRSA